MILERTERFKQDFQSLPQAIQRRTEKQLTLFLQNPRHPSLRIKKLEGMSDLWEGRITRKYRFTFQMLEDRCVLRRVGPHDILKTP